MKLTDLQRLCLSVIHYKETVELDQFIEELAYDFRRKKGAVAASVRSLIAKKLIYRNGRLTKAGQRLGDQIAEENGKRLAELAKNPSNPDLWREGVDRFSTTQSFLQPFTGTVIQSQSK